MASLTLDRITKNFGNLCAVNDLSLNIEDGEFVVLLGPSGAGKTTTLKLIAGVEQLTDGRIYIGDRLVNAVEPQNRNVAMAFETYALYPHYTVEENLSFPLQAPGMKLPKAAIKQKVYDIAEMLNIHMLLDRLPAMLSNGQKQRVALGRALVRDPDVLLLDEPISHLDAKLRHRMRTEFKALESSIQTTTVYVTHDYLEALSLGDRLAVIRAGSLQQLGKPQEIFDNPANIFVARQLGHPQINLVDCTIFHADGELTLISIDNSISVTPPPALRSRIETSNLDRVVLGLRPLHIRVLNGNSAPNQGFGARVYVYERLGTKGVLTVATGKHHINVLTPLEMGFAVDEIVRLDVDPEGIMVFDPDTEKNIVQ